MRAGLLAGALATASGALGDEPRVPLFGPKLLYYPLQCREPAGCRIDCYQDGAHVISRINLSGDDIVQLVVNSGIADEFTPRWIQISSADRSDAQTILLTRDTLCDLQGLAIETEDSSGG